MIRRRKLTAYGAVLLVTLFAGSVISRRKVEEIQGPAGHAGRYPLSAFGKNRKTIEPGLFQPAGRRLLDARGAIFRRPHIRGSEHYELLAPLLNITTELDPNLIVAYETGSIFLSQRAPEGAGQPDKAVALVEKGIRENPSYWRLVFHSWIHPLR